MNMAPPRFSNYTWFADTAQVARLPILTRRLLTVS